MTKIPDPINGTKTATPPAAALPAKPAAKKKVSDGQRISEMMRILQKMQPEQATAERYETVIGWVTALPEDKRPPVLGQAIANAFNKTPEEVDLTFRQRDRRTEFDLLVPKSGFLHDYVEWTRNTEPPTAFHFFVAATVLGASLGRNVSFDKGAYQVYPNLCIIVVAPTGRCRKTSACNLGTSMYVQSGGLMLADKLTPEALVEALKDKANAAGLIYAPELAVFLGKQKYNEGMVPLLTALFDCPKEWTASTIGRGDVTLTNVALSALLCSTIDWMQTAIPKDAFGGGFMSRFLFVVQESTPRVFPLPPPLNSDVKKFLAKALQNAKMKTGNFSLTPNGHEWYDHWYRTRGAQHGDKQYAGYFERKPDHMIRLAMVMKVAAVPGELTLSAEDLQAAERILVWLEQWLPSTFDEMTTNATGEDQTRIMRHLKQAGGQLEHSSLLRKNSSKMNAEQFRRAMTTLREAKLVELDGPSHTYFLTAEGWQ